VTEGIFALVGVLVGGMIQTFAAWWMERRREDWAARRAGRLLARDLSRARFALTLPQRMETTWRTIADELQVALRRWPDLSEVLAGTIVRHEDWHQIVAAIEFLERTEERASGGGTVWVDENDAKTLLTFAETVVYEGALTASLIGVSGVTTTRLRLRKLWHRIHPLSTVHLQERAEDLAEQALRAEGLDPDETIGSDAPRAPSDL
jgi:hypothetical protein